MKKNLARIALKIQMNEFEKDGPLRITDMIRSTVIVWEESHVKKVYEEILKIDTFQVIKLTNHM